MRRHFPPDDSERFSAPRLPTEGAYAALIAVATSGTSVLDQAAWAEVLRLNATVHDAEYERLCARTAGGCASPNPLLSRWGDAGPPAPGSLRFPVNDGVFLGAALGGVETDEGRVRRARALKLMYYLREDGPEAQDSRRWLESFLQNISSRAAELRLGSIQVTQGRVRPSPKCPGSPLAERKGDRWREKAGGLRGPGQCSSANVMFGLACACVQRPRRRGKVLHCFFPCCFNGR